MKHHPRQHDPNQQSEAIRNQARVALNALQLLVHRESLA